MKKTLKLSLTSVANVNFIEISLIGVVKKLVI